MKNTLLLSLVLLIGLSFGCKKVYNFNVPAKAELTAGEKLVTDKSQVTDQSTWTLVEKNHPNNIGYWKFKSGNLIVIMDPAPEELYWNFDTYAVGKTFSGTFIKKYMK